MSATRNIRFLMHSVDQEENDLAAHLAGAQWELHLRVQDNLLVADLLVLELFARDLDNCFFLACADLTDEDLVFGCDHLVKSELELTDKVMLRQSLEILEIIDVIHGHFENLFLLELVRDIEAFDPLWTEVVHDNLCHSNHRPHLAPLLVENGHAVRSRKRVHIW